MFIGFIGSTTVCYLSHHTKTSCPPLYKAVVICSGNVKFNLSIEQYNQFAYPCL